MGTLLSSFLRFRLWAMLLLAAITLQAGEPIRAPLERQQGSAFSAATIDLALAAQRRTDAATAQALPLPSLPPSPAIAPAMPRLASLAPARAPRLRPEARGPPPRVHPARLPDSTAPPFA